MRRKSIGLLIETSRGYGRGLLRGIARYARSQPDWTLLHAERRLADTAPGWLKKIPCDGIIARIETRPLLQSLRRLNIPIVDVRGSFPTEGIPSVDVDNRMISRQAVDHLLSRGFRTFGYCGVADTDFSTQRRDAFIRYLDEQNLNARFIYEGDPLSDGADTYDREIDAMLHEKELGVWLKSLPKPVGVLACNDVRGRQVLIACRAQGITVPDEVAVVGVDDDEMLCELADPPLSSVALGTERIGYESAAILDRMLQGKSPPSSTVRLEPLGVVTRLSSDIISVADRDVAIALRFIRDHVSEAVGVEQLLDHLASGEKSHPISRSTLERRFAETLGRSPKEEILRVRFERIRHLLLETDIPLSEIADSVQVETGHLIAIFKARTGETPGAFRRRMRSRQTSL